MNFVSFLIYSKLQPTCAWFQSFIFRTTKYLFRTIPVFGFLTTHIFAVNSKFKLTLRIRHAVSHTYFWSHQMDISVISTDKVCEFAVCFVYLTPISITYIHIKLHWHISMVTKNVQKYLLRNCFEKRHQYTVTFLRQEQYNSKRCK